MELWEDDDEDVTVFSVEFLGIPIFAITALYTITTYKIFGITVWKTYEK